MSTVSYQGVLPKKVPSSRATNFDITTRIDDICLKTQVRSWTQSAQFQKASLNACEVYKPAIVGDQQEAQSTQIWKPF